MLNFPPWKRLLRAVKRHPAVGCGGILLYHRITDLGHDPWSLAITPQCFDQQLAVLRRDAKCLSLPAFLAQRSAGKLPRNAVAVTFDDGYADNLHEALPILERHGVPATIFVMTSFIDSASETWWDRLEQVVHEVSELPSSIQLRVNGTPFRWQQPDPASNISARASLLAAVAESFTVGETAAREGALADLWQQLGKMPRLRPTHRGLSLAELRQLAAHPLITIGAHTQTHPYLARISPESQRAELAAGKADLERWLDRRIDLIAYPHGSYGKTTIRAAADVGFKWGFTTVPRIVPHLCKPLRLPRMEVRDHDGEIMPKFLHFYGIRQPWRSFAWTKAPAHRPGAASSG
jgi:peptidoglycan/xylan/chitin deacetylase (PgdA/CDA1 family)